MKASLLFTAALLVVSLTSCDKKQPYDNENENYDNNTEYDPRPAPAPRAAEQQRAQDSIRLAEEERIKQALIEEDKNMKIKDAEVWVADFSTQLMKAVSPISGKNLYHQLLLDESTYNADTKTLTAVYQTEWDAIATYAGGAEEKHIFKGRCILYGTGQTRGEEISQNEVLRRAIRATNAMHDLNDLLNKLNTE